MTLHAVNSYSYKLHTSIIYAKIIYKHQRNIALFVFLSQFTRTKSTIKQ